MLWSAAEAAIRAHVETAWKLTPYNQIPLVWENEIAPYSNAYLAINIEGIFGEKTIFGVTGQRESIEHGIVFYHAFVATGTGKQAALGPIIAMTAILELQVTGAGINFAGANPPSPVERDAFLPSPGQPGGMFYRCSGSVPFIVINAV